MEAKREILLESNANNFMSIGNIGYIGADFNPSTGYHWELTPDNSGVYEVIEEIDLEPSTKMLGASGYRVWKIKTIRSGEGEVMIEQFAPGQTSSSYRTEKFSLKVMENNTDKVELSAGSWSEYEALTDQDQVIFDSVTKELMGVEYKAELVSRQVVSGMNYRFKCSAKVVSPGEKPYEAIIQVNKPVDGTPCITDIFPMKVMENNDSLSAGSWSKYESLTDQDQIVFDSAIKELMGVEYKAELVSRQVVSGMNYRFKCSATVIYPGAKEYEAIVQVYKPIVGNPYITEISRS